MTTPDTRPRCGGLAKEFGPVVAEGSSMSTEAWLDRVLRNPARAVLARPSPATTDGATG